MNEHSYQFAVLRYIHDPVTEEFINVGVVLYSREARYVRASVSTRYSRLSDTFRGIDGEHYRRLVGYIERGFTQMHKRIQAPTLFDELPTRIDTILDRVLPADDSSLVFGGFGVGLALDLNMELQRLFGQLVERYAETEGSPSRTDQQVWQVYRQELDRQGIIPYLRPVTIRISTYHYEFEHAWRNERWYPIESVSFDLMHEGPILEKACKWIGRAIMLSHSDEIGGLYLLLGAPRREELRSAYENATLNMRENIPLERLEIVEEGDASTFSARLADEMRRHQPGE